MTDFGSSTGTSCDPSNWTGASVVADALAVVVADEDAAAPLHPVRRTAAAMRNTLRSRMNSLS
jgi:hypothetical protein